MRVALRGLCVLLAAVLAAAGILESVRLYRAGYEAQAGIAFYEGSLAEKDAAVASSLRRAAVPRLDRAQALEPLDPEPSYYLGRIAARERRPAEAVERLRASIRANPFDGRAHYYLGMALGELGRREDAARAMETAASFSRNNPDHQYWVGYYFWGLWTKLGRLDDLRKCFVYFRAAAGGDLAYLDRALKVLESYAIRYDNLVHVIPDTPEAHWRAGRYLGHARGFWTPALEEFRKAGTSLEGQAEFLLDRGLALLFTGGDPLPDLRRGVDLSADRKPVIRRLSWYFRAARREKESLPFWIDLEAAYPLMTAPVLSRVEIEMEIAKSALDPEMKKLAAERAAALARALAPAERKAVEDDFTRRGAALWIEALRDVERRLRDKVEAIGDPELRRVLAEVLICQARFDEAESCMRIGAETGGPAGLWKDLVEFLLRRDKAEEAWKTALEARRRFPEDKQIDALVKRAQEKMLAGGK